MSEAPAQGSRSSSSKEKLLTPANPAPVSVGKPIQFGLPPAPKLDREDDLKFIWITSNIEDPYEDYFEDYCTLIKPRASIPCSADEFKSYISDNSRIFLCVNAMQARNLLSCIHQEPELYLVYVLCQDKAEEDRIQREIKEFNKIRTVTSNQEEFFCQLAVDIVPSLLEIGDIHFEANDIRDASRWYESAFEKVNKYGGPLKHFLLATINKKIQQCL